MRSGCESCSPFVRLGLELCDDLTLPPFCSWKSTLNHHLYLPQLWFFFFERSHQFSSRKLFFESGVHYIKPQSIKIRGHRAQSRWIHPQHTRSPMVQKTGQKDNKRQRVTEFSVRFCLQTTSEATLWTSHECDCLKMSWKKDGINRHTTGKSPQSLRPTERTTGN